MIITYEPNFDNAFLQNFISNSFVAFLNYCTPSVPPPHSSLPTHHRRTPHSTYLITATAPLHHSYRTDLITATAPTSSQPPHHSSLPPHHDRLRRLCAPRAFHHRRTTAPQTHHSSLPTHHDRLRHLTTVYAPFAQKPTLVGC